MSARDIVLASCTRRTPFSTAEMNCCRRRAARGGDGAEGGRGHGGGRGAASSAARRGWRRGSESMLLARMARTSPAPGTLADGVLARRAVAAAEEWSPSSARDSGW